MASERTNSGTDLYLEFRPGPRLRQRLENALRTAIREGRLPRGTRLPPTRSLSRDLGVGRGTVTDAYTQLVAEGYLTSLVGSGTEVIWTPVSDEAPSGLEPARPRHSPGEYDWSPGIPDLSSFPRREWIRSLRRALAHLPGEEMNYGDPRGNPQLRQALCDYLGRVRGVRTTPDCVLICNGYSQALDLIGRTLRGRGARQVAVEDPGLLWHRAILQSSGLTTRALTVDDGGLPVEDLRPGDGAAIVTPAHQYPMGMVLAPSRRSELVEWAQRHDAFVVEDDYDGEFSYDRSPVGALQQLDPGRVIYTGTASKTLVPGLRLGWLVAPRQIMAEIISVKGLADRQTAVFDQVVLADLLVSGAFDRHVRRVRALYRQRRDRLIAELTARIPQVRVEGIAAGLHVLLRLPDLGPSEAEVITRAAARGVVLVGLREFTQNPSAQRQGLVLGYGRPRHTTYPTALRALSDALHEAVVRPCPGAATGDALPPAPGPGPVPLPWAEGDDPPISWAQPLRDQFSG